MPKKGVKTNRISHRDGAVCGVHLGGCMRPIENKGDRSLDHIIPQSFYLNPAFGLDSKAFGDDWNLQVMHKTCNVKRGGFVHGLPCFQCPCHYYRVSGKDLYVCYTTGEQTDEFLLVVDFVKMTDTLNPISISLLVQPVSDNPKSWPKTRTLQISPGNNSVHYVTCINPFMVKSFNHREMQRVARLEELSKRVGQPQGSAPVVYLNRQDNVNFDFGIAGDARNSNVYPFPFPR